MLVSRGVCVDLFTPKKKQDVDTSQLFAELNLMSHVHSGNLGLPESVLEQMLAAHSHMVNLVQPLEDVAEQRCISRHGCVKGCVKIHMFEAFKPWKVLVALQERCCDTWWMHMCCLFCALPLLPICSKKNMADMADMQ